MCVGGMSQRDSEVALEKALGQCVLSNRASSTMTDPLRQAEEACRTRDLSGDEVAARWIDTV
jgi:hypothetical protein